MPKGCFMLLHTINLLCYHSPGHPLPISTEVPVPLDLPYTWNHTTCNLSCFLLTQHNVCELIHVVKCMSMSLIIYSFCCSVFQCMIMLHFDDLFNSWGTFSFWACISDAIMHISVQVFANTCAFIYLRMILREGIPGFSGKFMLYKTFIYFLFLNKIINRFSSLQ